MTINEIKELLSHEPTAELIAELAQDKRVAVQKLLQSYHKRIEKAALEKERFYKMLSYERQYYGEGAKLIAGVDEAGRGPLAGPLVIAAVILPEDVFISGLNDSKQISASKRDKLYDEVLQKAISVSVNIVSISNIDELNIYAATKKGMEDLIKAIPFKVDIVLVDAMKIDVGEIETLPLIHGDAISSSIAAASIIAKVTRDRMMYEIDKEFPQYDFKNNKGYGTKKHMEAIEEYGICKYHRLTYYPVSKYAQIKLDI